MTHRKSKRVRCSSTENRDGNALVELVLSIPVIMLLTFGAIESANMNHLQQAATEASYEGGLTALTYGADSTKILAAVQSMLDARGITGYTITIEGLDNTPFDSLNSGDNFVVVTNIPADQNLPMISMFLDLPDLESRKIAQLP